MLSNLTYGPAISARLSRQSRRFVRTSAGFARPRPSASVSEPASVHEAASAAQARASSAGPYIRYSFSKRHYLLRSAYEQFDIDIRYGQPYAGYAGSSAHLVHMINAQTHSKLSSRHICYAYLIKAIMMSHYWLTSLGALMKHGVSSEHAEQDVAGYRCR